MIVKVYTTVQQAVQSRAGQGRFTGEPLASGSSARRTEHRNRSVPGCTWEFRAPRNAAIGPRNRFLEVPYG